MNPRLAGRDGGFTLAETVGDAMGMFTLRPDPLAGFGTGGGRWMRWLARERGDLRKSFFEAGEIRDHLIKASDREDAQDPWIRDHEQHLASFGLRPLVRTYQGVKSGRVAKVSAGQIDHQRPLPTRG